jgi:hypothetical protein
MLGQRLLERGVEVGAAVGIAAPSRVPFGPLVGADEDVTVEASHDRR